MRRVHNDNGTATQPPSPPASGPTTSVRGRKRKSDVSEKQTSQEKPTSRKSSNKAAAEPAITAPKQPEIVAQPEIEQWYEHQKALQALIQGCVQPDDLQSLQYIRDAQDRLNAMGRISQGLIQGAYQQSWIG
jgi:hypothetical protein